MVLFDDDTPTGRDTTVDSDADTAVDSDADTTVDSDADTAVDSDADTAVDSDADAADTLDPQAQTVVDEVDTLGIPEWSALGIESARRIEDDVFAPVDAPDVERVTNIEIPGPAGAIPVRVYHPDPDQSPPVLVFFHGGLWAMGTLDSIDGVCRRLARRTGHVVVSVDYRLAPEHPFPAGLEDCVRATEWVADNATGIGATPDRLAVAGTSAGGNLAAATCLYVREFGGPAIERQVLLYPMTDLSDDHDSLTENADGPLLTRRDVLWAHDTYLRSAVDRYNPFAAPLRADSHADLPPAYVVTAGFDPLRNEGTAYAAALDAAGVHVVHDHEPAMPHGFLSLTADVEAADVALDRVADAVRDGV
ncbi:MULTISPECIES: alpha/beta hydrolase [Haloferax]|uniref:Alpha/beta hydrolase fold domain-containing protein n=1 Tax=Haloferax marinum TaxID=2666143 RepID=A0A6A8GAJ8_9EURY|nr:MULTISPECIES: alpha/beta hydrolase [Haloferax]KAB1198520.1 alpha/beta hydrolase fold domain-containing protein [Haloferax sp. CBA1150]MRW97628.1 alpha/beta hydrolase fold domain-containing protein [Haloferax marinum]